MNDGQFSLFTFHQWNCNGGQRSRQEIILLHQSARLLCLCITLEGKRTGRGCWQTVSFLRGGLLPLSLLAASRSLASPTSSMPWSHSCILIDVGTFPHPCPLVSISPSPPLHVILSFSDYFVFSCDSFDDLDPKSLHSQAIINPDQLFPCFVAPFQ